MLSCVCGYVYVCICVCVFVYVCSCEWDIPTAPETERARDREKWEQHLINVNNLKEGKAYQPKRQRPVEAYWCLLKKKKWRKERFSNRRTLLILMSPREQGFQFMNFLLPFAWCLQSWSSLFRREIFKEALAAFGSSILVLPGFVVSLWMVETKKKPNVFQMSVFDVNVSRCASVVTEYISHLKIIQGVGE